MTHILASRSTTHDETLVYFVGPSGEIRTSPDNRIRDPESLGWKGWHCFEAKTAREKDSVSARMAEQLWRRKRDMEVQRHLREAETRNQIRYCCRIRQAKSPSKFDFDCNQRTIDKLDADEDRIYRSLCEEFDPAKKTSGFEQEWRDESTSYWGKRGDKQAGLNG